MFGALKSTASPSCLDMSRKGPNSRLSAGCEFPQSALRESVWAMATGLADATDTALLPANAVQAIDSELKSPPENYFP
jgi:hypothetical protein